MQYPGTMGQVDNYTNQLRKRLPEIPEGIVNAYVAWAPWIALIGGVIAVVVMLGVVLVGTALSPLLLFGGFAGMRAGAALFIGSVFLLVAGALDAVAGYYMLKRSLTGWWLLAAGLALGVVSDLLSVSFWGLIITLLILYVHLEAKPRYS